MAKKNRLAQVAAKIGTAVGRADRKAHQRSSCLELGKNCLEQNQDSRLSPL